MRPIAPIFLSSLLLAGCSLAPKYERPAPPVAAAYPAATPVAQPQDVPSEALAKEGAADLQWSQFFTDPRLQSTLRLALANNRDLRIAALNVDRARAYYGIQRFALIPSLDATGDATRRRTPGDLNASGQSVITSSYQVGVEIPSYELDFFGRVASLRDVALQQYLATEEAQRSAQISLISAVARQYFTVLAADEQLALARQTLAAAAALEQQAAQARNALTLLVGTPLPTDSASTDSLLTQNLIENLPAGLPADLLTRRPDLLAAEHTLQSANANIGIARAAFFPAIKLTAFGGTASAELNGLFDSGSRAWSFAPSITLPIFASGKNKAQLEVAKVQNQIALATYEKAIQSAFREVADALVARQFIGAQIDAQTARVAAATRRYELSESRFKAGVDSFLPVLLAQQDLFAAQQQLIAARLARLTNLTTLYAALGGGWSEPTP